MRLIKANVERIATKAVDIAKLESEGFVKIGDEAPTVEKTETAFVADKKKPGRKPKQEV